MLYSLLRLGSLRRDLKTAKFRRNAITLGTAAAMMAAASLAVATHPAGAGEVNKFAAPCLKIKDDAERAGCMIGAVVKNTQALKAEQDRQKQIGDTARATAPCYDFLIEQVNAGRTTKEEVTKRAGGNLTDVNVCVVAQGLGRRADARTTFAPIAYNR